VQIEGHQPTHRSQGASLPVSGEGPISIRAVSTALLGNAVAKQQQFG
jgi:hypothetical protein